MIKQIKYNRSIERINRILKHDLTYYNGDFHHTATGMTLIEIQWGHILIRCNRFKKCNIRLDIPYYELACIVNDFVGLKCDIMLYTENLEAIIFKYDVKTDKIQ